MNPLVSIIIPVYNGANYLEEAIKSALAQTYKKIEIIVVNDGSQDDGATEAVALKYSDKIRYIPKKNGGVSSALNTGIQAMKGAYFSWLSHDDLYEPNKIEKEVSCLENDKDIVLCRGKQIDFEGNPLEYEAVCIDSRLDAPGLFHVWLWKRYELNGLGFLIPKIAFDEAGLFDETLSCMQDLDMWIRIMLKGFSFVCIPDQLVITRIHKNQVTNRNKEGFHTDVMAMRKKHIDLILNTKHVSDIIVEYLYYCAKSGMNYSDYKPLEDYAKRKSLITTSYYPKKLYIRVKGLLIRRARKLRDFLLTKQGLRG